MEARFYESPPEHFSRGKVFYTASTSADGELTEPKPGIIAPKRSEAYPNLKRTSQTPEKQASRWWTKTSNGRFLRDTGGRRGRGVARLATTPQENCDVLLGTPGTLRERTAPQRA